MADEDHLTPQKYLDITSSARFIAMAWKEEALCLQAVSQGRAEATDWFPESKAEMHSKTTERAKAICHECPVRLDCLCLAIYAGEKEGIWGGRPAKHVQAARRKLMRILR